MLIAEEQLSRPEDRDHAHTHSQHGAGFFREFALQQVASARRQHDDRGRQVSGGHHVGEAVRKAGLKIT